MLTVFFFKTVRHLYEFYICIYLIYRVVALYVLLIL